MCVSTQHTPRAKNIALREALSHSQSKTELLNDIIRMTLRHLRGSPTCADTYIVRWILRAVT